MQLGKLGLRWVRTCLNAIKWIDVEKDCIGFWFMCYKTSAITNFNLYTYIYMCVYIYCTSRQDYDAMDYAGKIVLPLYDPISA
jgi:hypothetical protein